MKNENKSYYTQYKHLAVEDCLDGATEEELRELEQRLGRNLPEDFKEFLRLVNGGYLEYEVNIPGLANELIMMFGSLFCTRHSKRSETFFRHLEDARGSDWIPAFVLPFARDGGGSMIFLDLSETSSGRVVAYIDGLPAWTGEPETSQFLEVAPTFSQYLDMLYVSDHNATDLISNAGQRTAEQREAIRQFLDIARPNWREQLGPIPEEL